MRINLTFRGALQVLKTQTGVPPRETGATAFGYSVR
jgi:hypothetical protein